MTGVEVSRGWSNYLKTPWVNNVKSDTLLEAVLIHNARNDWTHFFTRLSIAHRGSPTLTQHSLNYDSLAIHRLPLKLEEAIGIIEALVRQGALAIPGLAAVPLEGTFVHMGFENDYLNSHHEQLTMDWPANVFAFEAAQGFRANAPSRTLVADNMPLYPDSYSAIKNELGVDLCTYQGWQNKVLVIVPNYMARIAHVTVGGSHLSVNF